MSRWNRPMRPYAPPPLTCQVCGQPVKLAEFGGFKHVRELRLRDWHRATVDGTMEASE